MALQNSIYTSTPFAYVLISLLIASSCSASDYRPQCSLFKTALIGLGLVSIPKPTNAENNNCPNPLIDNLGEIVMSNQNSINAPLPLAVDKGGTGIATKGPGSFTWQPIGVCAGLVPFVGYILQSGSSEIFSIAGDDPSTQIGDTYKIFSNSPGFSVQIIGDGVIMWHQAPYTGDIISTTDQNAAITIVCKNNVIGSNQFFVESTNGATFILS